MLTLNGNDTQFLAGDDLGIEIAAAGACLIQSIRMKLISTCTASDKERNDSDHERRLMKDVCLSWPIPRQNPSPQEQYQKPARFPLPRFGHEQPGSGLQYQWQCQ